MIIAIDIRLLIKQHHSWTCAIENFSKSIIGYSAEDIDIFQPCIFQHQSTLLFILPGMQIICSIPLHFFVVNCSNEDYICTPTFVKKDFAAVVCETAVSLALQDCCLALALQDCRLALALRAKAAPLFGIGEPRANKTKKAQKPQRLCLYLSTHKPV